MSTTPAPTSTGSASRCSSKIDQDTLSKCGTQITMKIQNPADQKAIEQSVEAAGEDVLDELSGLTPRRCSRATR